MRRTTRVQGAVIRDGSVLLIQHREHATGRTYWLLPGGAAEGIEQDDEALRRELREETQLDVTVGRLLFDDAMDTDSVYRRFRTYLCHAPTGQAAAGAEPEPDIAPIYAITNVRWLDLHNEATWDEAIVNDRWIYPLLKRLQVALTAGDEECTATPEHPTQLPVRRTLNARRTVRE